VVEDGGRSYESLIPIPDIKLTILIFDHLKKVLFKCKLYAKLNQGFLNYPILTNYPKNKNQGFLVLSYAQWKRVQYICEVAMSTQKYYEKYFEYFVIFIFKCVRQCHYRL